MATYTSNLNLRKPNTGEKYDVVADLNDTKDKIDTHAGAVNAQLAQIAHNVKSYGAKCDGVTVDNAAINAAINACPVNGTVMIPGKCVINDTIFVDKQINFIVQDTLIYSGVRDRSAIHFKRLLRQNIDINMVSDVSQAWHGWSYDDYVGITFENLIYCNVKVNRVANFTTGVRLKASGGLSVGHFFNNYRLVQLYNNKTQLEFMGDGAGSWINANTFKDSIFTYEQSNTEFQTADVSRYGIKDTHINGNTFPFDANIFKDFRFDTGVNFGGTYTAIYLQRAHFWDFNNYRVEFVSGSNVKFCILDNQYNGIKNMVFNPLLEMYTSQDNVKIHMINNETRKTESTLIYKKSGVQSNTINHSIHRQDDLIKKVKNYQPSMWTIKNMNFIDLNSTTLQNKYFIYGGIIKPDGNVLVVNGAIHITNLNAGDVITVNVKGSTDGNIKIKAWDVNGGVIEGIASNDCYYDTSNKAYFQNVNGRRLTFEVKDVAVKTVTVIVNGSITGYEIHSTNRNNIVKTDNNPLLNQRDYVVDGVPSIVGNCVPGDVMYNKNTTSGQPIGWSLQNGVWTAFGTY